MTNKDAERLARAEDEQDLTAAYMLGFEKGKDSAIAEKQGLRALLREAAITIKKSLDHVRYTENWKQSLKIDELINRITQALEGK